MAIASLTSLPVARKTLLTTEGIVSATCHAGELTETKRSEQHLLVV